MTISPFYCCRSIVVSSISNGVLESHADFLLSYSVIAKAFYNT